LTFRSDIKALAENPAWPAAVQFLRRYLAGRGYHNLYKNIVPPGSYTVTPSFFSGANDADKISGGGFPGCAIGRCLTAFVSVPEAEFDEEERALAYKLADIGMLTIDGGVANPRSFQLLSVGDRYLLIDAAIHFPKNAIHDIYIGPDSLLLMYCMGDATFGKESRALDLCSGSGLVGLFMAKTHANVVSTDISPAALALIRVNAVLNGTGENISIREEKLQDTLSAADRFDLVACNPPFVAFPSGFDRPLYAAGPDNDGLGYMRLLMEKVPDILNEDGEGYFVADMPGDGVGAYFFNELKTFSERGGCAVDVFVMNRISARPQIKAMTHFLCQMHPTSEAAETEKLVARFIFEELRASYYYLTIIKIKKSGKTGTRVLNQFGARRFEDYFAGL